METTRRVVITGHNAAGRSLVAEDRQVQEAEAGNFNFWQTGATDGALFPFFPGAGNTIFRLFQLPPSDPTLSKERFLEISNGFFTAIGWSGARVDTSRDLFMHRTPTTDFILLLQGEVSLLMDEGEAAVLKPFDAVVQRAANHAWINTGKTPALLMAVMVGGAA